MTDLIRVTKDGDVLDVHPTCLAAHQRAGWRAAPTDPLDHDGDGRRGGSKARAPAVAAPVADLTRREIEADLEGMGVEFHPASPVQELRAQRDAARAARRA